MQSATITTSSTAQAIPVNSNLTATQLVALMRTGDVENFKRGLNEHNVNEKHENGSLLAWAAFLGKKEICEILLNAPGMKRSDSVDTIVSEFCKGYGSGYVGVKKKEFIECGNYLAENGYKNQQLTDFLTKISATASTSTTTKSAPTPPPITTTTTAMATTSQPVATSSTAQAVPVNSNFTPTQLVSLMSTDDVAEFKQGLNEHNVNEKHMGSSLLTWAAYFGKKEICKILLDTGIKRPDSVDDTIVSEFFKGYVSERRKEFIECGTYLATNGYNNKKLINFLTANLSEFKSEDDKTLFSQMRKKLADFLTTISSTTTATATTSAQAVPVNSNLTATQLVALMRTGDVEKFKQGLNKHNINEKHKNDSLLGWAAFLGKKAICEILLNAPEMEKPYSTDKIVSEFSSGYNHAKKAEKAEFIECGMYLAMHGYKNKKLTDLLTTMLSEFTSTATTATTFTHLTSCAAYLGKKEEFKLLLKNKAHITKDIIDAVVLNLRARYKEYASGSEKSEKKKYLDDFGGYLASDSRWHTNELLDFLLEQGSSFFTEDRAKAAFFYQKLFFSLGHTNNKQNGAKHSFDLSSFHCLAPCSDLLKKQMLLTLFEMPLITKHYQNCSSGYKNYEPEITALKKDKKYDQYMCAVTHLYGSSEGKLKVALDLFRASAARGFRYAHVRAAECMEKILNSNKENNKDRKEELSEIVNEYMKAFESRMEIENPDTFAQLQSFFGLQALFEKFPHHFQLRVTLLAMYRKMINDAKELDDKIDYQKEMLNLFQNFGDDILEEKQKNQTAEFFADTLNTAIKQLKEYKDSASKESKEYNIDPKYYQHIIELLDQYCENPILKSLPIFNQALFTAAEQIKEIDAEKSKKYLNQAAKHGHIESLLLLAKEEDSFEYATDFCNKVLKISKKQDELKRATAQLGEIREKFAGSKDKEVDTILSQHREKKHEEVSKLLLDEKNQEENKQEEKDSPLLVAIENYGDDDVLRNLIKVYLDQEEKSLEKKGNAYKQICSLVLRSEECSAILMQFVLTNQIAEEKSKQTVSFLEMSRENQKKMLKNLSNKPELIAWLDKLVEKNNPYAAVIMANINAIYCMTSDKENDINQYAQKTLKACQVVLYHHSSTAEKTKALDILERIENRAKIADLDQQISKIKDEALFRETKTAWEQSQANKDEAARLAAYEKLKWIARQENKNDKVRQEAQLMLADILVKQQAPTGWFQELTGLVGWFQESGLDFYDDLALRNNNFAALEALIKHHSKSATTGHADILSKYKDQLNTDKNKLPRDVFINIKNRLDNQENIAVEDFYMIYAFYTLIHAAATTWSTLPEFKLLDEWKDKKEDIYSEIADWLIYLAGSVRRYFLQRVNCFINLHSPTLFDLESSADKLSQPAKEYAQNNLLPLFSNVPFRGNNCSQSTADCTQEKDYLEREFNFSSNKRKVYANVLQKDNFGEIKVFFDGEKKKYLSLVVLRWMTDLYRHEHAQKEHKVDANFCNLFDLKVEQCDEKVMENALQLIYKFDAKQLLRCLTEEEKIADENYSLTLKEEKITDIGKHIHSHEKLIEAIETRFDKKYDECCDQKKSTDKKPDPVRGDLAWMLASLNYIKQHCFLNEAKHFYQNPENHDLKKAQDCEEKAIGYWIVAASSSGSGGFVKVSQKELNRIAAQHDEKLLNYSEHTQLKLASYFYTHPQLQQKARELYMNLIKHGNQKASDDVINILLENGKSKWRLFGSSQTDLWKKEIMKSGLNKTAQFYLFLTKLQYQQKNYFGAISNLFVYSATAGNDKEAENRSLLENMSRSTNKPDLMELAQWFLKILADFRNLLRSKNADGIAEFGTFKKLYDHYQDRFSLSPAAKKLLFTSTLIINSWQTLVASAVPQNAQVEPSAPLPNASNVIDPSSETLPAEVTTSDSSAAAGGFFAATSQAEGEMTADQEEGRTSPVVIEDEERQADSSNQKNRRVTLTYS